MNNEDNRSNISLWLLGALFAIVVLWWFFQPKSEHFREHFELPGNNLPLGSKIHVRLTNDGDNALYESYKPPSAHGELGCTQVPCPSKFPDSYTCWWCCNFH